MLRLSSSHRDFKWEKSSNPSFSQNECEYILLSKEQPLSFFAKIMTLCVHFELELRSVCDAEILKPKIN